MLQQASLLGWGLRPNVVGQLHCIHLPLAVDPNGTEQATVLSGSRLNHQLYMTRAIEALGIKGIHHKL
jgi:hypothetical protein